MKNPIRPLVRVPVSELQQGFPVTSINWPLKKNTTFDEISGATLSKEIKNLGLDCPETSPLNMESYIHNVRQQLGSKLIGVAEAVVVGQKGTLTAAGEWQRSSGVATEAVMVSNAVKTEFQIANGANPEAVALMNLVDPEHYDWLKAQIGAGFPGQDGNNSKTAKVTTVTAIQDLFYETTHTIASVIPTGISWNSVKSILVRAIGANTSTDVKDYKDADHRIVVFTSEPVWNEEKKWYETKWVGAFRIDWNIYVKDYQHKAKDGGTEHDATVESSIREIAFDDADLLGAWDTKVKEHFQAKKSLIAYFASGFPVSGKAKVFDHKPQPAPEVFSKGVPVGTGDPEERLILFSSGLESIGVWDNSQSKSAQEFTESVTLGFTTAISTKAGISATVGVNVGIVEASATVSFELTLSAQWNTQRTTSITIKAPAGETTYAYQGILQTAVMRYDSDDFSYSWVDDSDNTLTTNFVQTSQTPLMPN